MVFVTKLLNKKLLYKAFGNNAFINIDSTTVFDKTKKKYYTNNININVPWINLNDQEISFLCFLLFFFS